MADLKGTKAPKLAIERIAVSSQVGGFVSWTVTQEGGEPMTVEEAQIATLMIQPVVSRMSLVPSLARGAVTSEEYKDLRRRIEAVYRKLLDGYLSDEGEEE